MHSFDWVYQRCGLVTYEYLESFQQKILYQKLNQTERANFFIVSELFPTIAYGPQTQESDFLFSKKELALKNVSVYKTPRGGRATYHGRGQLVVYFVVDLKQVGMTVSQINSLCEDSCRTALSQLGLEAYSVDDYPGVWVESKKVASIGLRFKRFVSYYGMSLNVLPSSLEGFSLIRPCGLNSDQITCLQNLNVQISLEDMGQMWFNSFKKLYRELSKLEGMS